VALAAVASVFAAAFAPTAEAAVSIYGRALPDEPVPYLEDEEGLAPLTPPIVLFGDPFLDPGNVSKGFELPTGAVWTPSLWVFGQGRTALQTQDTGDPKRLSEWANTLDLFANLQLSGTERVLVGINPLRRGSHFSGYRFEPDDKDGGFSRLGANLTTLLFEGDFGELFPNLDPNDELGLDYGFAVGRQALTFQQDILINDTVDGVGIVRNNLTLPNAGNLRITGFYGWNEITRPNNFSDRNANLFGLFSQADFYRSTVALDLAYVDGDRTSGDGLYIGASAVQRFRLWTNSVRLLMSQNVDGPDTSAVKDGLLLFVDFSTTPLSTDDIYYITLFGAMGEFTQAAKDQTVGGPLTRAGILFASPQLGTYVGPLSARANDVIGFSVGRQWFLVPNNREQLVLEAGARWDVAGTDRSSAGIAGRYQIQIHNQAFWQFELYGSVKETEGPGYGARSEIQFRF
jgi:hypothetical protein